MQSFLKLVEKRRSVRRFQDKPVQRDLLRDCVEAARLAPSAENVEPWRFVIVDDPDAKATLANAAFSGVYRATRWAEKAPALVVLLSKKDILANRLGKQITGIHYYLIDIGIAGEHFVLQAADSGLGTCWIGWFDPRKTRKVLDVPASWQPVAMLAVGHPATDKQAEKKRRSLDDILFFNSVRG